MNTTPNSTPETSTSDPADQSSIGILEDELCSADRTSTRQELLKRLYQLQQLVESEQE